MLIKLTPEQASKYWDVFVDAIRKSVPPHVGSDHEHMNNLLEAALTDKLQCWVSYQRNKESLKVIDAVAVTTFTEDFLTKTKNLLIYSLYSHTNVDPKSWIEAFETGTTFAKAHGCRNVVAYSQLDYFEELGKQVGVEVDMSYRFIIFPLK